MSKLVEIIQQVGLVSPSVIAEMRGWGMPVGDVEVRELGATPTVASISQAIADAIEGEGYVLMRETDLDIIPQYIQTMRNAVLHVVLGDDESADFEALVGHTHTGEWVMPWRSDSITDMLTNGQTYLRVDGKRIYFSQAREMFYGEKKAFIICSPSTVEVTDGHAG